MIKTTAYQESHTLISVKVIETSESSFSTCTDATSPSWQNDTEENTGMQISVNDNHSKISYLLLYPVVNSTVSA